MKKIYPREYEWRDPKWSEGGHVHNWKNHLTEEVKTLWPTFTKKQKYALYQQADWHAMREEWD
jgi:hypothetical protein